MNPNHHVTSAPSRLLAFVLTTVLAACAGPEGSDAKATSEVLVIGGEGASSFLAATGTSARVIAAGARLLPGQEAQLLRIAAFDTQTRRPDPRFGIHGLVEIAPPLERYGVATDVTVDGQGRIIACGHWMEWTAAAGVLSARPFLVRLLPDGQVDAAFAEDGFAYLPSGSTGPLARCAGARATDAGYLMLLSVSSPAGSPASGLAETVPSSLREQMDPLAHRVGEALYLVRFTEGGALDRTFGTGGQASVAGVHRLPELETDAGGRILVKFQGSAAPFLHRYTASGERDADYGEAGVVQLHESAPWTGSVAWRFTLDASGAAQVVGDRQTSVQDPQSGQVEDDLDGMVWRVDPAGHRMRGVEAAALAAFGGTQHRIYLSLIGASSQGLFPVTLLDVDAADLDPRLTYITASGNRAVPDVALGLYPFALATSGRLTGVAGSILPQEGTEPEAQSALQWVRLPR